MESRVDCFIYNPGIYSIPVDVPDAYVITTNNKGWRGLIQRLSFSILRKTKAINPYVTLNKTIEYNTVTIDFDRVEEQLYMHMHQIQCVYGKRIQFIVVGRDIYQAIIGKKQEYMYTCSFPSDFISHSALLENGIRTEAIRLAGVPVLFLPWFEGIVAVPEL
jgi:hypothetical protein